MQKNFGRWMVATGMLFGALFWVLYPFNINAPLWATCVGAVGTLAYGLFIRTQIVRFWYSQAVAWRTTGRSISFLGGAAALPFFVALLITMAEGR